MLDVTPTLTGTYAELRPGASSVRLAGVPVWVCSPEEVLRRLPDKPRLKDIDRAEQYASVRETVCRGEGPRGGQWLDVDAISDSWSPG